MKDNNRLKTIVVFDCRWPVHLDMQSHPRGLEPVDFSPRNGWKVGIR